jgi:hypothetical protein
MLDLVQSVLTWVFGGAGQVGLAAGLIGAALYWRKALGIAGILSDWVGRVVFSLVVIGLLLLTGIIPTLHVGEAISLARSIFEVGVDLVTLVL